MAHELLSQKRELDKLGARGGDPNKGEGGGVLGWEIFWKKQTRGHLLGTCEYEANRTN